MRVIYGQYATCVVYTYICVRVYTHDRTCGEYRRPAGECGGAVFFEPVGGQNNRGGERFLKKSIDLFIDCGIINTMGASKITERYHMTIKDIKILAKHFEVTASKRAEDCESMARESETVSGAISFEKNAEYNKGVADAWGAVVKMIEDMGE